jgi:glycosyltransferase involved in cell wall biosynthesis
MRRASLFVLSSLFEGSPNSLIEALAVGTPVVATDCHSGPREILQDEKFGPLVPVGDVDAMAKAMLETLENPPDRDFLKSAADPYRTETCTRAYLQALGIKSD